jgi:FMN-dependent oxidoreductase (nitrilotriacetate monooxygenase family)
VVTTGADNVYGNFGLDKHPEPAVRYEQAHEFIDVVKGLWDSFEDDAFFRDPASGKYFDPAKVHAINHSGKYFKVSGPLNLERPPQGYPVIVQAGSSEPGRELAAASAEAIFTAWTSLAEAQAFYRDVKGRLAKYGRRPEQLLVLPGISPVVGRTQEEADAKWAELQKLIHPAVGLNTLHTFWPGEDLSKWDLDAPPPYIPEPPPGQNSRAHVVLELARRDKLTVRQLYEYLAGARGHWVVVGTPQTIADKMQEWFENGAADGFNVMPPVLPESLNDFVELVIPELQRRGLFRTEYEGSTLRENLGLDRPANQFTVKAQQGRLVRIHRVPWVGFSRPAVLCRRPFFCPASGRNGHRRRGVLAGIAGLPRLCMHRRAPAVHADRHITRPRDAAHHAVLVAVVVDGVVLGGAVVPDHDVALRPAPAHGVFQADDVLVQHPAGARVVLN